MSPLLFVLAIDPIQHILDLATSSGILQTPWRGPCLRTSLYADDAAIFGAPLKEDIDNLMAILKGFGNVTSLVTNVQKCSVVPIRCSAIDLDHVLWAFPAVCSHFPVRYLGMPVSVFRMRAVDFQHLFDKMAGKLVSWEGRLINVAGRGFLVRVVISTQAIYHLTPLIVPKGITKAIASWIELSFGMALTSCLGASAR